MRMLPWLKLIAGTILLGLLALTLFSGYTPPGVLGEVIRHNRDINLDASPFFYNDVENMTEILNEAEQMHLEARLQEVTNLKPETKAN